MPLKSIETMPDDARLWSFGCSRALATPEETAFLERLDTFLDGWQAHGRPLDVARKWLDGRLLLVAVDERTAPPSGCSIDALVRTLKEEGARLEATLVDNAVLWVQGPSGLPEPMARHEFATQAAAGEVDADTVVYDFTVTRLADLRQGHWETRAGQAWHASAFSLGVAKAEG